jgi:hypothetical protein
MFQAQGVRNFLEVFMLAHAKSIFWSIFMFKLVLWIRKYFFRIRICGSVTLHPGGPLWTQPNPDPT